MVYVGQQDTKKGNPSPMSLVNKINQSLNSLKEKEESFKSTLLHSSQNLSVLDLMEILIPSLAQPFDASSSFPLKEEISLVQTQNIIPSMNTTFPRDQISSSDVVIISTKKLNNKGRIKCGLGKVMSFEKDFGRTKNTPFLSNQKENSP